MELSVETLAADIYVSKYYFIRKFRNSIGMTPHQFCIQNRIRKSQRLLDGKKTISGIAAEMGFYDQSHFVQPIIVRKPWPQKLTFIHSEEAERMSVAQLALSDLSPAHPGLLL